MNLHWTQKKVIHLEKLEQKNGVHSLILFFEVATILIGLALQKNDSVKISFFYF